MPYNIIDAKELAGLFENARIQLQQDCMNIEQATNISSLQENCAFLFVISTYLEIHRLNGINKALLIDELIHCLQSEISVEYILPEADYKTILEILLRDY